MYLSTSDYVQHKHAPGDAEANRFYGAIDRSLAEIDRLGATLVDHRRSRHAREGRRGRAASRRSTCRTCSTAGSAPAPRSVVLPITDPYVLHHGALGSLRDGLPVARRSTRGGAGGADSGGRRASTSRWLARRGLPAIRSPARSHRRHRRLQRRRHRDRHAVRRTTICRRSTRRCDRTAAAPSRKCRCSRTAPVAAGSRPRHNYDAFDVALNGCA